MRAALSTCRASGSSSQPSGPAAAKRRPTRSWSKPSAQPRRSAWGMPPAFWAVARARMPSSAKGNKGMVDIREAVTISSGSTKRARATGLSASRQTSPTLATNLREASTLGAPGSRAP